MNAVLIPTFSEEGWLEATRSMITASEIAVVLGLSPYSSPFALYYRKRGDLPAQPDNDAMAIGRAMENFVCDQFARRHPEFALFGAGREPYVPTSTEYRNVAAAHPIPPGAPVAFSNGQPADVVYDAEISEQPADSGGAK